MRLWGRVQTYTLIVGVMAAVLVAGLSVPVVFGSPVSSAALAPPSPTVPSPVTDHDTRPVAFLDLPLVAGDGAPPGVTLSASDVGVTPTTVTVGVILVGLGAISAFGIDTSALNPAVQRGYWDAAAARVNARGGIAGRRLSLVYAVGDILSTDSMRAACRSLTEDHRVFAVANVLGVTGDPILCVARDHATPYVAIGGADAAYYRMANGRLVTLEPSVQRTLASLASIRSRLAGHRIGVIHDGIDSALVRRALPPITVDGPLSGDDPLVVSGQVSAAERRMQAAGVDTVVLLTNAVYGTVFATQADQDRYTPAYVLTDLGYATAGDSFLANMPPSFFRSVVGVTSTEVGRGKAGLPESALDTGCRLDYQRRSGKQAPRDSADAVAALASCALVQLITMGLNGAGPNPTRTAFAAALAEVGAFAVPGFGRAFLGAGRLDAADETSIVRGRGDCQCFDVLDGFRPATP